MFMKNYKKTLKIVPFIISFVLYAILYIIDFILPTYSCDGVLILLWVPILLFLFIGIIINIFELLKFLYVKINN